MNIYRQVLTCKHSMFNWNYFQKLIKSHYLLYIPKNERSGCTPNDLNSNRTIPYRGYFARRVPATLAVHTPRSLSGASKVGRDNRGHCHWPWLFLCICFGSLFYTRQACRSFSSAALLRNSPESSLGSAEWRWRRRWRWGRRRSCNRRLLTVACCLQPAACCLLPAVACCLSNATSTVLAAAAIN